MSINIIHEGLGSIVDKMRSIFESGKSKDSTLVKLYHFYEIDEENCRRKFKPVIDMEVNYNVTVPAKGENDEDRRGRVVVSTYQENPEYVKCQLSALILYLEKCLKYIKTTDSEILCKNNLNKGRCLKWVKTQPQKLEIELKRIKMQLERVPKQYDTEQEIRTVFYKIMESKGVSKNYIGDVKITIAKIISESQMLVKSDKINMIKKLKESNDSAVYNLLAFGCLNEIKNERLLRRAKRLSESKIIALREIQDKKKVSNESKLLEQEMLDYNAIRQLELKFTNCLEGCKNRPGQEGRLCSLRCNEAKIRETMAIYNKAMGQCNKSKDPRKCQEQLSKKIEKLKGDLEKAQDKTRQYAASIG
jgi:hypothetical protein